LWEKVANSIKAGHPDETFLVQFDENAKDAEKLFTVDHVYEELAKKDKEAGSHTEEDPTLADLRKMYDDMVAKLEAQATTT
jgi:hypothetical protein